MPPSTPDKNAPGKAARQTLLDQFSPPGILIDADGNILHVQGHVGRFVEPPTGPPTHSLLELARPGLRIELASTLRTAKTTGEPVSRPRLALHTNGDEHRIDLHVLPLPTTAQTPSQFLVVFVDAQPPAAPPPTDPDAPQDTADYTSQLALLERELQLNRDNHQTTMEELESSNEELKSANEELQSTNEELQSTNEELESSKEELQSLNEELQTLNAELESKLEDLAAARDDTRNLLNGTDIATIFVDNKLRIRRFTPQATVLVNLIGTDLGRPLEHVMTNLRFDRLIPELEAVRDKLIPFEGEVQTTEGVWHRLSILPYRTMDNRIDGAVITFSNIDTQKQAEKKLLHLVRDLEATGTLVRNVFDIHAEPMLVVDREGRVVIANAAFATILELPGEVIEGQELNQLAGGLFEGLSLDTQLRSAVDSNRDFQTPNVEVPLPGGDRSYNVEGRIIRVEDEPYRILVRLEETL